MPAYGARDEHYDKVGEALLWTLERGLAAAFTPEAKRAWTDLSYRCGCADHVESSVRRKRKRRCC